MHKKLDWGLFPVIFALAWPTIIEQIMGTAVQYIDTAMVGSLGTEATAAVGATSTIGWMVGSTISALGVGLLAFISQAIGAKNEKLAVRASGQAVLLTVIIGIFFTAVTLSLSSFVPAWMQVDPLIQDLASQYFFIVYVPMLPRTASIIFGAILRAAGDTKTPMRAGIIVNILNVILNFLLIYPTREINLLGLRFTFWGADMGVIGAAVASAVAFTVGGICITVALWRHPFVSPKGQSLKPDWTVLRPCLKVAIPNMFQRFGTSLGYVAFAAMINSLGEIATAAHTIANTVESAFYIPGYGIQTAAATLAGNAHGARDSQRIKELTKLLLAIEVVLMIGSGSLLFIFAPNMMQIFSTNEQVIWLGAMVLRMVAVSEPFYGISIILEGMMQGMGNTMRPFAFNLIGMWGIRIVGTFIFTQIFSFDLRAAWACMIAHNMLLCVLFIITWLSGKLQPKVEEQN